MSAAPPVHNAARGTWLRHAAPVRALALASALWLAPLGAHARPHAQPFSAPVPQAGALTWERVEAPAAPGIAPPDVPGLRVARLEKSQADPQLGYAFLAQGRLSALLRTTDAGRTWTELARVEGELCAWVAPVLTPDPSVRDRLFFSAYCAAGRTTSATLLISEDAGATFRTLAQPNNAVVPNRIPLLLFPVAAVMDPSGQYAWVAARRDDRLGGSVVLASRDGGTTWLTVLEFPTVRTAYPNGTVHAKPEVKVTGLAADFTGPRLTVALGLGGAGRGVLLSQNGGVTWTAAGQDVLGVVSGLRWEGTQTQTSLVATGETGTWRLRLGSTELDTGARSRNLRPTWAGEAAVVMLPVDDVPLSGPAPPPDRLARPYGVAVEPDGAVLVANWGDRDGARPLRLVRAWPGTDRPAELLGEPPKNPAGSVWRSDGVTFVADPARREVRAVAADGSATVVAGTGAAGPWPGDRLEATATPLDEPWAVALDTEGRLIVVDRAGQRVVRLEADGTLRTVAGSGAMGYSGDGGPATAARLSFPVAATVDAWGRIYLADLLNHAVRVVDVDGTLWTLAGPRAGEAGPPAPDVLDLPMAVAWDGAGGVYVASHGNDRLVYVPVTPPTGARSAGSLESAGS